MSTEVKVGLFLIVLSSFGYHIEYIRRRAREPADLPVGFMSMSMAGMGMSLLLQYFGWSIWLRVIVGLIFAALVHGIFAVICRSRPILKLKLFQEMLFIGSTNDFLFGLFHLRKYYHLIRLKYSVVSYTNKHDYASAEPFAREALNLGRTIWGDKNRPLAILRENLGRIYRERGNFGAAQELYLQALKIRGAADGENLDSAHDLVSLAWICEDLGDYEQAEKHLLRMCDIVRRTENHPLYANGLSSLAVLYMDVGNYEAAEKHFLQALAILAATVGQNNKFFASSLTGLGYLYYKQRNYKAAEECYLRALNIGRAVYGEGTPETLFHLNNLAEVYEARGEYPEAERLYCQALDTRRRILGEEHWLVAAICNDLAALYVAAGRESKALTLLQKSSTIYDQVIGHIFSSTAERQRMQYLETIQESFSTYLSLVSQHLSESPEAVRAAFDLVLRRKAIGAEALAAQRDAVLGGRYPHLKPKLRELTVLRMKIAQKTLAGSEPEDLAAHQQLIAEWNVQKEQLEAELARQIPEMNLEQRLQGAGRQAVTLALPEGGVLVEFVRFNVIDFKAVRAQKEAHYLAFVLPAGEPDNVRMVNVGEAECIDQMIAAFRAGVTREAESRSAQGLGAVSGAGQVASSRDGVDLRRAIFDLLLPALGGRKRLLLAPDGDLSRLPFEVLPTGDGRRLIDDYQISYLGAGRDVLRFGTMSIGEPAVALVAADPDFDLSSAESQAPRMTEEPPGRRSRDDDWSKEAFDPLPGTREEGEQIARMLGVQPWLGGEALEKRIKESRSPRILHLATHGFFQNDQRRDRTKSCVGLGAMSWPADSGLSGPLPENPLLRSGLALAGANWKNKRFIPPPEAEDGLLTAEDVTGLDLLATELVVLSACETGLGKIHVGEGVFGLRRAFVLAGAKALVMSLWKVPDQQTQELMVEFYTRILEGQPRAEALRASQLVMKKKYRHPLYWGAFIYQGEPSPLP